MEERKKVKPPLECSVNLKWSFLPFLILALFFFTMLVWSSYEKVELEEELLACQEREPIVYDCVDEEMYAYYNLVLADWERCREQELHTVKDELHAIVS